jgi:antibiotic biosynthesis monooxygenase (ABM) superfamily enzyme
MITTRLNITFNAYAHQTVVRWIAIYPTITLVFWGLKFVSLLTFPTYVNALVITLIAVPVTHYLALPVIGSITSSWVRMPLLQGSVRHKMAIIIWCCTYPVITALLYVTPRWMQEQLPLPVLTFWITVLAVPVISYLILPYALKSVGAWFFR